MIRIERVSSTRVYERGVLLEEPRGTRRANARERERSGKVGRKRLNATRVLITRGRDGKSEERGAFLTPLTNRVKRERERESLKILREMVHDRIAKRRKKRVLP